MPFYGKIALQLVAIFAMFVLVGMFGFPPGGPVLVGAVALFWLIWIVAACVRRWTRS